MTQKSIDATQLAEGLSVLGEILNLIDAIRQLSDPATSAAALKEAIALVLQLATSFGLDQAWLNRISAVLNNDEFLAVLQAFIQYVSSVSSVQSRRQLAQ